MREFCPRCGSSTALGEVRCFKCNYRQVQYTTKQLYTIPRETEELELPEKLVFNPHAFHSDGLKWLNKSYIFNDVIIKQGLAYVPEKHKLFLPHYEQNVLKFYQLRDLREDSKIRYITVGKTSPILYGDANGKTIYIVEDHLSAMRLRRHTDVLCLSGTYMPDDLCSGILKLYEKFVFWLDPDRPGRMAMYKCMTRLKYKAERLNTKLLFTGQENVNYSFLHINYDKLLLDPKYYSDSELREIINSEEYLCGKDIDVC